MNQPIPDSWPPDPNAEGAAPGQPKGPGGSSNGPVVPLFPLANVWLFPGAVMPLHIFEPRYRAMIEDSLDQAGRIVIGTVVDGEERNMAGAPAVYPVAGLGEIGRHERLPDGRFLILLLGLSRVRLTEVPSERAYRKVRIEPFAERCVPPAREASLRQRLHDAVLERTGELLNLPENLPVPALTDLLLLRMPLPHPVVRRLYAEADQEERAELALAEHAHRPHLDPPSPPRP